MSFQTHKAIMSRSDEDIDLSGEDVIRICAVEQIEMKFMDCNAPYKRVRVRGTSLSPAFCMQ